MDFLSLPFGLQLELPIYNRCAIDGELIEEGLTFASGQVARRRIDSS